MEKRHGVRSGWQGNNRLGDAGRGGEGGGREVGRKKGQVTVAMRKGQEVNGNLTLKDYTFSSTISLSSSCVY